MGGVMEKECRIGEIKQVNGEWYQCVEGNCAYCSIQDEVCEQRILNDDCKLNCIFKKLKKVGEPCEFQKRTIQTYKLYTEPFITVDMDFIWAYLKGSNTIDIITKQDIEDMEEKKLNLKPFDIEAAKAGKLVCTRDGRKARIICFDAKGKQPIIALFEREKADEEIIQTYNVDGSYYGFGKEDHRDLMMLPEKKEGWVNLYDDFPIYDTKEEALNRRSKIRGYIDTVKVSWEE